MYKWIPIRRIANSLIRCMESLSYVVWRSVRTLYVAPRTHVCLNCLEKRASGGFRPNSDKIINRNKCFETVFDSVRKSYFWGSVLGDSGIRFSRGSQERLEAETNLTIYIEDGFSRGLRENLDGRMSIRRMFINAEKKSNRSPRAKK